MKLHAASQRNGHFRMRSLVAAVALSLLAACGQSAAALQLVSGARPAQLVGSGRPPYLAIFCRAV